MDMFRSFRVKLVNAIGCIHARRRVRRSVLAAIDAAAIGVLALFAQQQASAQPQTVTLFIGTTPDYANIYVARDKGFFEAEGLKLDIRLFPSGTAATDGFRSGKVEFVASGDIPAIRLCEVMGSKIIAPTGDGVEVILAQTQQGQVALEDGAVGNARANRKSRIDHGIDIDALEILADQSQPGVGTEVVGQFFDNKVGHLGFTFRVNSRCRLSA